jgi:signal recognition particle subunit SRP54
MTPHERQNPEVINGSRKKRIAVGCGRDITEVNRLMKQFDDMKKMMKVMQSPGGKRNMMNMFGGM